MRCEIPTLPLGEVFPAPEVWPEFCCSYQFDGDQYSLIIPARDAAEAARRLRAIGMTASVDGELYERIPVFPGSGLYVRAKTALFNLFRK